jgi:hypothetical protein
MKRPKWVSVVGILGVVFGCFGILGSGQMMIMPKMMEMQKNLWSSVQETMEKQGAENPKAMPPKAIFEAVEDMLDVPDWFGIYCAVTGVIGLFVSGFYIFAAVQLLQTKPGSIQLFYSALGLDIGFAVMKGVVAVAATSFIGMMMMMGSMFGVVLSIILLVVTATGDKQAFTPQEASAPQEV